MTCPFEPSSGDSPPDQSGVDNRLAVERGWPALSEMGHARSGRVGGTVPVTKVKLS
jgi:hypothetical protein